MEISPDSHSRIGQLALVYGGRCLDLAVLKAAAGYYIGTSFEGGPCSRESAEYFATEAQARGALETGQWTQRSQP